MQSLIKKEKRGCKRNGKTYIDLPVLPNSDLETVLKTANSRSNRTKQSFYYLLFEHVFPSLNLGNLFKESLLISLKDKTKEKLIKKREIPSIRRRIPQ